MAGKFTQRQDNADYRECMEAYGPSLSRCIGGRLVVSGYICPRCDSIQPSDECFDAYGVKTGVKVKRKELSYGKRKR